MNKDASETSSESSEVIRNHPDSHPANHPNPSSLVYRLRKDRMADGSDDQDRIRDLAIGLVFGEEGKK